MSAGFLRGDYAVVFSMAVAIPASVLRSLALYAGCNPWSNLGDVVAANANLVAVHSIRPGKRTIHLPAAMTVTDAATGGSIAERASSFPAELAAPDTRVFLLSSPTRAPQP